MFPPNNCYINEPVYCSYNDQSGFHTRPFPCNDITSDSKQDLDLEDNSLPLVGIHLDDHDFLQRCCDLLLPFRPDHIIDNTTTTVPVVNMLDSPKTQVNLNPIAIDRSAPTATLQMQMPRKRALKKDRHSKINTARGLRDRRMRLSLEVARPFFNLQDKLGYDKASKTVEWLLIKAEPEIKKLESGLSQSQSQTNYNYSFSTTIGAAKSASSTSECEVVSGTIKSRGKPSIKGKKTRQSRKFTLRPLTRDLREKARARARARTSYRKIMIMRNGKITENNHLNNFFENGEESGTGSHNKNHSSEPDVPGRVDEPSSHDQFQDLPNHNHEHAVDDPSVIQAKWSPSSIFNYSQTMGILQEHQFSDFQLFSKQYEA